MDNQWVNAWKEAVGSNYRQNVTNCESVRIVTKNCGFVFNSGKKNEGFLILNVLFPGFSHFAMSFKPFFSIFLDKSFLILSLLFLYSANLENGRL